MSTTEKTGHLATELARRIRVPSAHCEKGRCFAAMNGDRDVPLIAQFGLSLHALLVTQLSVSLLLVM